MGILDIFHPLRKSTVQKYKELGVYQATFSVFGNDPYSSSMVRSCVRPLAEFSSKAEAKCKDKNLERVLNGRPNVYMNGKDFVYKVRTRLEILNTSFIYIQRDNRLKVTGLYPVPFSYFEAVEYANRLFIKFYFAGDAARELVLPWEDLAVLRKDYNKSDISGDDNASIIKTLQMLQTADEGLANSIRSTANLRGILKSTKAMLAPEKIKQDKEEFVKDYLSLENKGGIAALDSTQEFIPVNISPSTASAEQRKDIREDVYRFFGVNDEIVMSNIKTEQLENFYRLRIEPFLVALSRELTSKIYTGKAQSYDNEIFYTIDSGLFMTMAQKLQFFSTVVMYGGATINEFRKLMGMDGIEGGDVPIRRLDADYITGTEKPRQGNESAAGPEEDPNKEENEDGKTE